MEKDIVRTQTEHGRALTRLAVQLGILRLKLGQELFLEFLLGRNAVCTLCF